MVFIILMGPSGSGKSTIASLLQRRTKCTFIEGDAFHSPQSITKMSSGVPLTDEDRLPWLEHLHAEVTKARSAPDSALVVVACSALKRHYREILSRPPNNDAIFVFLNAPRDILESRVRHRTGHFFPPTIIQTQLDTLELPSEREENFFSVDATLHPEEIASLICANLGLS